MMKDHRLTTHTFAEKNETSQTSNDATATNHSTSWKDGNRQSMKQTKQNPTSLNHIRMKSLLDISINTDKNSVNNDENSRTSQTDHNTITKRRRVDDEIDLRCNNGNDKKNNDDDCNGDTDISNLSPSSMEVTFSDPHTSDHSSFSRRQTAIEFSTITTMTSGDNCNHDTDCDESRDEYVRSGAQFRSLLDCALRKVATGFSCALRKVATGFSQNGVKQSMKNRLDQEDNVSLDGYQNGIIMHDNHSKKRSSFALGGNDENNKRPSRRRKFSIKQQGYEDKEQHKFTAQLAREKMTEVLSLKRVSL
jgi:hypothetical protein